MGEKGTGDKPEPTLELPSLRPSFRRKKRSSPAAAEEASASPVAPAPSQLEEVAPPAAEPADTDPVAAAPADTAPGDTEAVDTTPGTTGAATPDDVCSHTNGDTGDPQAIPGGRRRNRSGPLLPALTAVVLTGLLVGLVGAGATFGGLQTCEVARGTSSCGDPGFFILVAIVAAMMLLGTVLLKLLEVSEPRGVSLLGVGLLCVIVLVGQTDALFSPWMFLVLPVLTALTFTTGRWVTTRFVDPVEDEPGYDVR